MNRVKPLFLLAAAAVSSVASASTVPATISPAAASVGVPVADVGLFASSVTFFDPSARGEDNNNAGNALGAPDGSTVSLGDLTSDELVVEGRSTGVIVVEFDAPVFNGPGADIAVFENGFDFDFDPIFRPEVVFAELAFVEVSTNGSDFARFPAVSLNVPDNGDAVTDANEVITPFGDAFAGVNSEFISNLAGVTPSSSFSGFFGTPFDLEDLTADTLVTGGQVDLNNIRFVRFSDIPGTGDVLDSLGNPIFDASLTVGTGGFDLDAVGALNVVPEPSALVLALVGCPLAVRRRRQG